MIQDYILAYFDVVNTMGIFDQVNSTPVKKSTRTSARNLRQNQTELLKLRKKKEDHILTHFNVLNAMVTSIQTNSIPLKSLLEQAQADQGESNYFVEI